MVQPDQALSWRAHCGCAGCRLPDREALGLPAASEREASRSYMPGIHFCVPLLRNLLQVCCWEYPARLVLRERLLVRVKGGPRMRMHLATSSATASCILAAAPPAPSVTRQVPTLWVVASAEDWHVTAHEVVRPMELHLLGSARSCHKQMTCRQRCAARASWRTDD